MYYFAVDLERLGYKVIALGFFEEDVQAAFTTDCECVVNPTTVQYIRALTVVGMLEFSQFVIFVQYLE